MDHPVDYRPQPLVIICADSEPGVARCRAAADALDARHGPALPLAEAAERLELLPAAACVLVDAEGDAGPPLDGLFDRLNEAAARGSHPSVINVAPALIDIAAARAPHSGVALLCRAGAAEWAAALGLALARPAGPMLREVGDEPTPQLRQLSEEVGRIARALALLSGPEHGVGRNGFGALARPPRPEPEALPPPSAVRSAIRLRRLREQFFEAELFADPAWDMLLDLFLARLERRPVAVSSLCIAAAVPPTTALRWIKRLTDDGLFIRAADPRDGRRVFIDLSEPAAAGIAGYFRAAERAGVQFA